MLVQHELASSSPPAPLCPATLAHAVLGYLTPRLQAGLLRFAEEPVEIPDGWETYIYRLRLDSADALPPAFARPLVLRVYAGPQGVPRARREFAILRHLHARGVAVPEPLLFEEDYRLLGGPFLLMEWVPGTTLLQHLRRHYTHVLCLGNSLGEVHRRLHQLPVADFPTLPGSFLARRLTELQGLVHAHELHGLVPGLDWLCTHQPPPPEESCILHLDYHPINVIAPNGQPHCVLDWSEADVGDRHADVATTVLLMHSAPVAINTLSESVLELGARRLLILGYLYTYQRYLPLHRPTLRYYLALAALRRLGICGQWRHAGPESNGCKPAALCHVNSEYIHVLQECFRHWTGLAVRL